MRAMSRKDRSFCQEEVRDYLQAWEADFRDSSESKNEYILNKLDGILEKYKSMAVACAGDWDLIPKYFNFLFLKFCNEVDPALLGMKALRYIGDNPESTENSPLFMEKCGDLAVQMVNEFKGLIVEVEDLDFETYFRQRIEDARNGNLQHSRGVLLACPTLMALGMWPGKENVRQIREQIAKDVFEGAFCS